MAIEKLTIEPFLQLSKRHPILDVRSPGEYKHAHIPGAYNLPLFTDEERKIVGTAYQQENQETAIKIGLEFFGKKMRHMVEQVETFADKKVFVHCWRGGMRSAGVSWLLDLYGFRVCSLSGGYKSFRRHVLSTFTNPFHFHILGGFTGSGKTDTLKELTKFGGHMIDLENLAHHKGSAFGDLGQDAQPSQEMFENSLAMELNEKITQEPIWIEDESQRIGALNIPPAIWNQMKQSPLFFLDIPFEERLNRILEEYGAANEEYLASAILRIQKRLGGLQTKRAIGSLMENNRKECFLVLLKYYDKCYGKTLDSRRHIDPSLYQLECSRVDIASNTKKLLNNQVGYKSLR